VAASLGQLDLEEGLRSARPAEPLLLVDLNGFKANNDTFGHPAGDALLVRLATALEQAMAGHGGSAYRLGGDEFCISCPDRTRPRPSWSAPPTSGWTAATTPTAGRRADPRGGARHLRLRRLHRRDLPHPHAPRRTVPEAVAELRRVAGSRFDPAVVDAFSEQVVELVWPPAPAPARVSGGAR
jgi:GGDEF domain-containing protein